MGAELIDLAVNREQSGRVVGDGSRDYSNVCVKRQNRSSVCVVHWFEKRKTKSLFEFLKDIHLFEGLNKIITLPHYRQSAVSSSFHKCSGGCFISI